MRYTTLKERKEFYTSEFTFARFQAWLGQRTNKIKYAVIIGRHTKIFPKKYEADAETTIIIDEYKDLQGVQNEIFEFLPEAVYYDRNVYDENGKKTGQELAFDLDPENITCPIHGSLADKMKRGQGLSFCSIELKMVKNQAMELHEYLEKQFSNIQIVYSGRGFHLHVFDKEAYALASRKRTEIAATAKKKGFQIDEWVTAGEMRLIRLPYSLNGLVSRIALPIEKSELEMFNPIKDERCIPRFLKQEKVTSSS
jgi:DNA primase catalytic subunit